MLPGDAPTTPLPLTARIVIALDQLKIARKNRDADREFWWADMADRLLDRHIELMKASCRFRILAESYPELDARLSVKLDYKLIGAPEVKR